MGYQISYDSGIICKKTIYPRRFKGKRWIISALLVIFTLILLFPTGRIWVRDLILPGNEAVTASALEELVQDIRQGTPFSEAITCFCQQIIYGS